MSNRPLLVAVEKCQLCGRTRKQFSCPVCVKKGDFFASSETPTEDDDSMSFADKLKRLKVVVAVRDDYHQRVETLLERETAANQKDAEVILLKNKIESLQVLLIESGNKNRYDSAENAKIEDQLLQKKALISRMIQKIEKLKTSTRLQEKKLKLHQYKERLHRKHGDLKKLRVSHVQALTNDIFPLSQREIFPEFGTPPRGTLSNYQLACEDVVSETLSTTELELEEATRTVHIGGRWVSQSSTQIEYTIVDVGMPVSDYFMKYFEWLKSYRNEPRNSESQLSTFHAINILNTPASLIYTAQLTDGLAFFLGINLPNKIDYSNFGILQVSRQRLFQTINKLSKNIMHLCFSQLLPISELDPNHLLKNLQLCVSSTNANLGWYGPFETFDYVLHDCPFDSDSSAEELNYDSETDTESVEREEWDRLIDLPPDPRDIQSDTPSTSFLEQSRDRSLTSSASGLVTSAAASFSALWSYKRQ